MERVVHGWFLLFFVGLLASASCSRNQESEHTKHTNQPPVAVPSFSADSAYSFIQRQVRFGPRIPNTISHKEAGDYLIGKLKEYGARVSVQEFEVSAYDGRDLQLRNIIGSFFPEQRRRIILAAHWDTRPYADEEEEDPAARFDGANDGASGVAVLLEIVRALHTSGSLPKVGIDIIFFDGEDYGPRYDVQPSIPLPDPYESWWCLGSQYWSRNKHQPGYAAYYGILLDMVGARGAQFRKEGYSVAYAPRITAKIWNSASRLGYGHYFVNQESGEVTDDHKFVNEIAKIPMVDIINYDPESGSFGAFWHTKDDNIELIGKETLTAVGNTVLYVVYNE